MKKMKWLKGLMFALVCVWITSSSLTVQAETNVFEQLRQYFHLISLRLDRFL